MAKEQTSDPLVEVDAEPLEDDADEDVELKEVKDKKKASDNLVRVSRRRPFIFYARRVKKMLQTHDHVVLQGLGKAIVPTVEISQHLIHEMDCKITKIQTQTTNDRMKKKKIIIEVKEK
ncbi:hypothetical protein AAMO2058_001536900 [Amorphochlora amoebiformis]|uniref:DNA/RNA-binding protein Alba-like domain-containing protein n=1 Tax=Amorphochlora amoebiformis TaxID=1561963 RepID=A0A7S0H0W3_9EUKA|eukprot:1334520-Amorphochlora_amoeboformis.AAC.1